MVALFKKEIRLFFSSLTGYLSIVIFLAITGLFLWVFPSAYNIIDFGYASLDNFFLLAPYVFLFLIPAITMRFLAEEKRTGTIETLYTRPLTDWQIIMAKYLAGVVLTVLAILPTLVYVITVYRMGLPPGNIDLAAVWGSYIGLVLLAAAFVAIGIFASAFTSNQIVAFMLALFISGFVFIGFDFLASLPVFGSASAWVESMGIQSHYTSLSRGVIDTRDIVYYLSVSAFFLLLAHLVLASRKWESNKMAKTGAALRRKHLLAFVTGLGLLALVNVLSGYVFHRFDLTAEKRFTLSKPTKSLLKKLDEPVLFRVYLEGDFPSGFKKLSKTTREMLEEFRAINKNIQFRFIDPSASGERNKMDEMFNSLMEQGLQPTQLNVKTREGQKQQVIFPGALVSSGERVLPVSLLDEQMGANPDVVLNNSEQSLEFILANSVRLISLPKPAQVGFATGFGELEPIQIADMIRSLQDFADVKMVRPEGVTLDSLDLLFIARPLMPYTEQAKYAVDQFIMKGGRVVWLLDAMVASMDSLDRSESTVSIARELNLDDQLFRYGVRINKNLVLDLNSLSIPVVTGQINNQPQFSYFPWPFYPVVSPGEHPAVRNLNAVKTNFVSSIDTVDLPGVRKTPLLVTSPYSRAAFPPALISLELLKQQPDPKQFDQGPMTVAMLLEGSFSSLFANRNPEGLSVSNRMKEVKDNKMVVIADGDLIRNEVEAGNSGLTPLPLGYDKHTAQTFGNRDFILNIVNYLLDETDLISSRAKNIQLRKLDPAKVRGNTLTLQLVNVAVPILAVIFAGVVYHFLRKRKYAKP